jgi:hypothetical protein
MHEASPQPTASINPGRRCGGKSGLVWNSPGETAGLTRRVLLATRRVHQTRLSEPRLCGFSGLGEPSSCPVSPSSALKAPL